MSDENSEKIPLSDYDLLKLIRKERDFLHDLASPLMIASGMLDTTFNKIKDQLDEKAVTKLEKSSKALVRMTDLLKKHRQFLVDLGKENGVDS